MDLVPIPLCGNKAIVGMDWLSPNGAVIDCEQQLVMIRTPSGGELVIQGERPHHGPVMGFAVRARRYLHPGYLGFVVYVMDTQDKGKAIDVLIVREYPDVFLEDLHGVLLERQAEFRIDLVPGTAPIAKAPYRLAPPNMNELST